MAFASMAEQRRHAHQVRRKFILARPVKRSECPWLGRDYDAGEQVFEWSGYTYGCVRSSGVAVSAQYNVHPFFELLAEAITSSVRLCGGGK